MKRLVLFLCSFVVAAHVFATSSRAWAEPVDPSEIKTRTEQLPKRLQGVDVKERLESKIPANLGFETDGGQAVMLGELFRDDLPVIVTLNYSDCPMLCSLQLNALVAGMKQLDLDLGEDYRIVTVLLDPEETLQRTKRTKQRYLAQYGRPSKNEGAWTFLRGSGNNVHAVAQALGFSYGYNEARDEYVHPAAFVITTPDGTIARYMYGLEYHPKTLRLSLVEASEGKIGSTVDRLILYCFHYDESEGRYAPVAMNIMRLAGGAAAIALALFLGILWRAERRKKRQTDATSGPPSRGSRASITSAGTSAGISDASTASSSRAPSGSTTPTLGATPVALGVTSVTERNS